nr:metalloregulator ArsR/SmtB family transcription factor [Microcella alkalica]
MCRAGHTREVETLFLLAHPLRWRLIEILASGEHSAGQLADAVQSMRGVGREAISKHLGRLRRAGLIEVRIDMNNRIYRLSPRVIGALDGLVAHLLELRTATGYDDLDLDGGDRDIGWEAPPTVDDEEDVARCWCIRRSLNLQNC